MRIIRRWQVIGSLDCRVLMHYFWPTSPLSQPGHATAPPNALFPTPASRLPVWGSHPANPDNLCGQKVLLFGADRTELVPTANVACGLTAAQLWNPVSNPTGERCAITDFMRSVFGVTITPDAPNGKGRVAIDNVGVQYGLAALNAGQITVDQFLDLNEKVGGFGIDAEQVPERLAGDDYAIANAYRSGAINEGNNLDQVPIIDHAGPDPGLAHDYVHTWWMRDRLMREQGHLDNHVLWFGPTPLIGDTGWATEAMLAMDRWLTAIEKDTSKKALPQKIVDDKPEDITDRCTATVCEQYVATRYETPRSVAGGPKTGDVNKCQLKPPAREDYPLTFTDADFARLQQIFPNGVCDWSKPGVEQQGLRGTWLSF